jgi:DNA-directed RNA polymerase subunit RPC12/RpoP
VKEVKNMTTIEIAINCDECDVELEVMAEYDSGTDSVEYVCSECGHNGGVANWKGADNE